MFDSDKFKAWLLSPAKNRYFELDTYEQLVVNGNLSFSATEKGGKLFIYPFNSLQPDLNDDRLIRKKYPIEIDFSADRIPKVKVPEDIIKKITKHNMHSVMSQRKTDLHLFTNNICCLSEEAELTYRLKNREITEENFIEQIVIPFFYRFGCSENEMTPPKWGERSHDFRGLLESYGESGAKWDEEIFLYFVCRLKKLIFFKDNGHLWKFINKSTENLKLLRRFNNVYGEKEYKKQKPLPDYRSVLIEIRKRYQRS